MAQVTCLVEAGNRLGEAPMWHGQERAVYWVDAKAPAILRGQAQDGAVTRWEMPELTASLVFRESGGLVAAMQSGFKHVDLDSGAISNRRPFVSTADIAARVDGATVDTEGNYWCAHVADWHVACYSPAGDLMRRIKLPVQYPPMCSFGGDNLDTLFVTSISETLTEDEAKEQPLAGSLLAITDIDAQGIPEPFCAA